MLESNPKFLLITIQPQKLSDEEALKDLKELKSLVETYGGVVSDLVVQKREIHDKGSYIGDGKIREVEKLVKEQHITAVVLNAIVKPTQLFDLKNKLYSSNPNLLVWDRVDLILQIFAKHASTAEAKLQIELAAMRHMGPRIYGMGNILSRQGGGIGTLGVGETNTELMKRHWREQMKKTKEKLAKLVREREQQLEHRRRIGYKTVSIIGYTNAGKTALFNMLTKKKKYVENELFATLDSNVGKHYFPTVKKEALFSDTIGFIQNLPPGLIDAFKSTLLETVHADLLLHVIDVTDDDLDNKIHVVNSILRNVGIDTTKQLYVFNKIDAIDQDKLRDKTTSYSSFPCCYISALNTLGIDDLLEQIESHLF